jgi:hypothetical protein
MGLTDIVEIWHGLACIIVTRRSDYILDSASVHLEYVLYCLLMLRASFCSDLDSPIATSIPKLPSSSL